MKPHPRIHKTIKWGGAAVTVLLVVVWIGSAMIEFNWQSPGNASVRLHGGFFSYYNRLPTHSWLKIPGTYWSLTPFQLFWWAEDICVGATLIRVLLWMPVVVAAGITLLAWRCDTLARRRAHLNHCPKCNYDRAGIGEGAVCPECGAGAKG